MQYYFSGLSEKKLFGLSLLISTLIVAAVSQVIWYEFKVYQVSKFSSSVIRRADNVELSLRNAFTGLEKIKSNSCSLYEQDEMREIVYKSIFIKDVGFKFSGGYCTASKGVEGLKKLSGNPRIAQEDYIVYDNQKDFIGTQSGVDLISKGDKFVVLSPFSYSEFDDIPSSADAFLYSKKENNLIKKLRIGDGKSSGKALVFCSFNNDVCLKVNVKTGLGSCDSFGFIMFVVLLHIWTTLWFFLEFRKLKVNSSGLAYRLRKAIENKLIGVEYQPIVKASNGALSGFEVLARWNDEKLGCVSPEIFFKEASELGLSKKLTCHIIERSLTEFSAELESNRELYLSINLNASELMDSVMVQKINEVANSLNINLSQVAIEILEGSTANLQSIEEAVKSARCKGFKVFIDDFGSGYSSLAYLSTLNVDNIKIDRVFTNSAGTDSPSAYILSKVCEIAQSLGACLVFEGVETHKQRDFIIGFYPDALAQGWLFSKSVPMRDVYSLLEKKTLLPECV